VKTSVNALGIQTFLRHLIDYAGLFPPASLSLENAIENYRTYKFGEDEWMLGPFVVPASRLKELDAYAGLFSREKPLAISAIGEKSGDAAGCLEALQETLAQIEAFRRQHGERVSIGTLELPLPPVPADQTLLEKVSAEARKLGLMVFCEVTTVHVSSPEWEKAMMAALDAIAAHHAKGGDALGFKLRTGGVTADMFPSPQQLAAVIAGCRDRQIPMKFTAGLHHPIRSYREEIGGRMHGFLNVFIAGMIAHVHGLGPDEIARILADEDPGHFRFTDEGLGWLDYRITNEQIAALRSRMLRSYGCCSFDEPREDLRALKFLA